MNISVNNRVIDNIHEARGEEKLYQINALNVIITNHYLEVACVAVDHRNIVLPPTTADIIYHYRRYSVYHSDNRCD